MSLNLFGWELLLSSVGDELNLPEHYLVAFSHWRMLIGGYRAVGLGEAFENDHKSMSELLPKGWNVVNDEGNAYFIRYRNENDPTQKYLLNIVKSDEVIILNLLRIADEKMTNVSLGIKANLSNDNIIKNIEELANKIDKELLDPVKNSPQKSSEQSNSVPVNDPLRAGPAIHPQPVPVNDPLRAGPVIYPQPDPFGYGDRDRDPLGGGMIFDPIRGRGRRGQPRFDPVNPYVPNPMGRGLRGRRNFGDAMPPPGFDNMFG